MRRAARQHAKGSLEGLLRAERFDHHVHAAPVAQSCGPAFVYQALTSVQDLDAFTPDNDPLGERDFGVVHVEDETVFWKIDYYDRDDADTGADDPADPQTTRRILTILLASEY